MNRTVNLLYTTKGVSRGDEQKGRTDQSERGTEDPLSKVLCCRYNGIGLCHERRERRRPCSLFWVSKLRRNPRTGNDEDDGETQVSEPQNEQVRVLWDVLYRIRSITDTSTEKLGPGRHEDLRKSEEPKRTLSGERKFVDGVVNSCRRTDRPKGQRHDEEGPSGQDGIKARTEGSLRSTLEGRNQLD